MSWIRWRCYKPHLGIMKLKFVTIGDSAVGKTSFVNRLMGKPFFPHYLCTIGIDFIKRTFPPEWARGTPYSLHPPRHYYLWDTAGQERFRAISQTYFKGIDGALLFYDVNLPRTIKALQKWIESARRANNDRGIIPIVLVGNKIDLERLVTYDNIRTVCASHPFIFHAECSAKTGEGINEVLMAMVKVSLNSTAYRIHHPLSGEPCRCEVCQKKCVGLRIREERVCGC